MSVISHFFEKFTGNQLTGDLGIGFSLLILAAVCIFAYWVAKKILIHIVEKVVKHNRYKWDDFMYERGVFHRLALIVPALVVHISSIGFEEKIQLLMQEAVILYLVGVGVSVINALLTSANDIYRTYEASKNRPIKGYLQVLKIVIYVIGGIVIISTITNKSPVLLLSGMGALSAIILVIFKDSLLGLVAGIQLSANDMVRIGDWIEMPDQGADGDVIDISLNTVKVRNFDKTITTVPTYSLVSSSFKNWRGMSESGGRRIKRSILLDMTSVTFVDQELLEKLKNIQILKPYILERYEAIETYNKQQNVDEKHLANGRHLTNIGLFRKYVGYYLSHHPHIRHDMIELVRQRDPSELGVALELYCFTDTTEWLKYEEIQSDIFDHIFAVLPYFELRVFQQPTGYDFQNVKRCV